MKQFCKLFAALTICWILSNCTNGVTIQKAINNHISFELSDPSLAGIPGHYDSTIFVGLVFEHCETVDSLRIIASHFPPFSFDYPIITFLGTKAQGRNVMVYAYLPTSDESFKQRIASQWIPDDIDTVYNHYITYLSTHSAYAEAKYINTSSYVLGKRKRLYLIKQYKRLLR